MRARRRAPADQVPMPLPHQKPIPPRERLIFALDVADADAARRLAERLGDSVVFYKLGLELAMAPGYWELIDWFNARGCKVFADLKFHDIPATVQAAVRQVATRGARFCTLHAHRQIMDAAVQVKGPMQLLGVTVLTSFDRGDVDELGTGVEVEPLVLHRARQAQAAGVDGIVCSGRELVALRAELGHGLITVVPGIRPGSASTGSRPADDQKRTMSAGDAFRAGADYIVVGRPIRDAADPRAAAEGLQATIAEVFG
jgi:orotidine-5'-phosphate decarboxylase